MKSSCKNGLHNTDPTFRLGYGKNDIRGIVVAVDDVFVAGRFDEQIVVRYRSHR